MSTDPTSSQQEPDRDLVEGVDEDLDVDEDAAKSVTGGARRTGDPCDGGELT